jgi:hypothetical protein
VYVSNGKDKWRLEETYDTCSGDGKDVASRSGAEEGGSGEEKGAGCELHLDGWTRDELSVEFVWVVNVNA